MKEQISGPKKGQEEQNRTYEKETAATKKAASFSQEKAAAFFRELAEGNLSLTDLPEDVLKSAGSFLGNSFVNGILSDGSGGVLLTVLPEAWDEKTEAEKTNPITAPLPLLTIAPSHRAAEDPVSGETVFPANAPGLRSREEI